MSEQPRFGFLRYLTASPTSRMWLVILALTLAALCVTGIAQCTTEQQDIIGPAASDSLDAAGLTAETETDASPNRVNTSQLPDSSFIYDVSIEELANADSYINGQIVQVTGEVVGDRIIAEDNPTYCWITLQSVNKTDSELTVYMPLTQARSIDTYGAYGKRGTTLQVRGTFQLSCTDHQGSSEMHADNVAIVSKGATEHIPFDANEMIPGLLLVILGCILALTYNVIQERQR